MAGTLTISTLSDGTNSTSATNCISGSAKAWVNFNGSAATINASFNVSSITRNSTGDYTINFTNALSDANYAASGFARASVSYFLFVSARSADTKTTSAFRIVTTRNDVGNLEDASQVFVSIFR